MTPDDPEQHRAASARPVDLSSSPPQPRPAKRVRIEVDGLDRDLRATCSPLSASRRPGTDEDDLTEERIRRLHAAAPEEIARRPPAVRLLPAGRPGAPWRGTGDTWVARYAVEPGPPLKVDHARRPGARRGADDPGFQRAGPRVPADARATTLYHPDLRGRQGGARRVRRRERLSRRRLRDQRDPRRPRPATPRRSCCTSTPVRATSSDRSPSTRTSCDPDLLRGYVTLERGEPLNLDELLAIQNALSDSPYFQRVEVLPRQEQAQGLEVPIEVNLIAEPAAALDRRRRLRHRHRPARHGRAGAAPDQPARPSRPGRGPGLGDRAELPGAATRSPAPIRAPTC